MIDLSSDTATKPTAAMRRAMADAEVGDEQRGEDPTVNRLLAMVAGLLGKEAALFLPSGTMCNQVAIKAHTRPGDTVLVDRLSHVLRSEGGGPALLSGVTVEPLDCDRGILEPETVEAAIAPEGYKEAPATLVSLEQAHNFGGGTVWRAERMRAVCEAAGRAGLKAHLEGARLMNAVVATGVPAHEHAAPFDSVWIDFTKGLGAPLGAVLAGSADFIGEATRYKHVFGGALRQAGIAAAGCVHALENHVGRLAEDHENARLLAEGLARIPGVGVQGPVETNMVYFDTFEADVLPQEFLAGIEERGVRMGRVGSRVRAVTHIDVSREDVEEAVGATRAVLDDARRRTRSTSSQGLDATERQREGKENEHAVR